MRNLDPARAKREREIDHLADPVDVGTVHHRIHGERELVSHDLGPECSFLNKSPPLPAVWSGDLRAASLVRDRYMFNPAFTQPPEPLLDDPTRGGIEIG